MHCDNCDRVITGDGFLIAPVRRSTPGGNVGEIAGFGREFCNWDCLQEKIQKQRDWEERPSGKR